MVFWAQSAQSQSIRPASDRLDTIVSYPLIIPIIANNERDLRSGVITKLDDGRTMRSTAYWVGITPALAAQSWTKAPSIWTATQYTAITKFAKPNRPIGTWFIHIPMPIDAVGQGLWIEGERYELNWLPDPQRTNLEANLHSHNAPEHALAKLWAVKLSDQTRTDPAVQTAIDQYHKDPFQNWRARLLTDGLDPSQTETTKTLAALDLELSMNTPGADLLRLLAHQYQARWQIILGRIWLIDPAVAFKLKSELIRTAQFGNRTLPIWTSNAADLAQLAHDLLSPFVDDQTRVLRAKAWLEKQPRALAWVTDDQGQIEAGTNRFIPTITLLSLPQTPGSSLFRVDSSSSSPELSTISPELASPVTVSIDPVHLSPSNPVLESQAIRIRTGRWNTTREVIASPTPARAPYVRIGPLLNDWTMDTLRMNLPLTGAAPHPTRTAIGMLRKTTPPTRSDPTTGWQLYIELASADPQSPNESLTLWVGPYTQPFASWTITPAGDVTFNLGSRLSIGIPHVQTRILDDRWIAMINLPSGAFDSEHILQLGLERTDANNNHTAWPRRMIPDQPEPGRLSIQADNFDQLAPH